MKWVPYILILFLAAAAHGQAAQETPFQAAGGGPYLWIIEPFTATPGPGSFGISGNAASAPTTTESAFAVFYRGQGDPRDSLMRVGNSGFTGRPSVGGVAAVGNHLWIVYDKDLWVQSIVAAVDDETGLVEPTQPSLETALPKGGGLIAFTADEGGPWALLRVESRAVLEQIDKPPPPSPSDDDEDAWEGSYSTPTTAPVATAAAATAPAPSAEEANPATQPAAPQAIDAARLLRLERNHWVKVELPKDWPQDARGWLLSPHPGLDYPVLLAAPREGGELWAYRHDSTGWTRHVHKFDTTGHLAATVVEGQVIVAHQVTDDANLVIEPTLLRPDSEAQLPRMTLPGMKDASWVVARAGQLLALIARDKSGDRKWVCQSLGGGVAIPPTALVERFGHSLLEGRGFSPQVIFMVVSLLIMFLVWRRDGQGASVELPAGFVVAGLSRRAVAGLIDLAPCVLAVSLYWDVPLRELAAGWINPNPDWDSIRPMLVIVGLFAAYSCFAEVFTARTIGKVIFGLRVAGARGTPPNIWQVIGRNLLKTLDVLFPPVLLVPLMQPFGQRLGDMAAHTVVVMREPEHRDDSGKPPEEDKP